MSYSKKFRWVYERAREIVKSPHFVDDVEHVGRTAHLIAESLPKTGEPVIANLIKLTGTLVVFRNLKGFPVRWSSVHQDRGLTTFSDAKEELEIGARYWLVHELQKGALMGFFTVVEHKGTNSDMARFEEWTHPQIGTLWRTVEQAHYISANWWQEPGFDWALFINLIWEMFQQRMEVVIHTEDHNNTPTFGKFRDEAGPVFGDVRERLAQVTARAQRYQADQIPRTYLLIGPPGSGKSTFAIHIATQLKGRVLRMDVKLLTTLSHASMHAWLTALNPDVLIIDDIDYVFYLSTTSTDEAGLLRFFASMKTLHPQTLVILTANDESRLPDALLRPGRIDEVMDFPPPHEEDRKLVIAGYADTFAIKLSSEEGAVLAKESEGMTQAYIRELVLQMRYSSLQEVLTIINRRKKSEKEA